MQQCLGTEKKIRENLMVEVSSEAMEKISQNSLRMREFPQWASGGGWDAEQLSGVGVFPAARSIAYDSSVR